MVLGSIILCIWGKLTSLFSRTFFFFFFFAFVILFNLWAAHQGVGTISLSICPYLCLFSPLDAKKLFSFILVYLLDFNFCEFLLLIFLPSVHFSKFQNNIFNTLELGMCTFSWRVVWPGLSIFLFLPLSPPKLPTCRPLLKH